MPRKLVRNLIPTRFSGGEFDRVEPLSELNDLYELKVKEELNEIISAECKDVSEFADLIQVVEDWAAVNGITLQEVVRAKESKALEKGVFDSMVLINLNPNNPSNHIYFQK
jgi:predicted house-cleaning noncanonical NTP pyrophosphatase (MazG superfamily)